MSPKKNSALHATLVQAALITKNVKLLLRSKAGLLVLILGPLLVLFFAGTTYNTIGDYRIKMGVYTEEYTPLGESVLDAITQHHIQIKRFKSMEGCIILLKQGEVHACMRFPKNMSEDADVVQEITLVIDSSRTRLAGTIEEELRSSIYQQSINHTAIFTSLLLEKINITQHKLAQSRQSLEQLQGSFASSGDSTRKEAASELLGVMTLVGDARQEIGTLPYLDPSFVASPISVTLEPIVENQNRALYVLPLILLLLVLFTSFLLGISLVGQERRSPAALRNAISPVGAGHTLLSIYLTVLLVTGLQATVLLLLALFFFGVFTLLISLVSMFLVIFLLASFFIILGMCIGAALQSENSALLAGVAFACFLLVMSGIIFPLESMPVGAGIIAEYNPVSIGENMLRQSVIYNIPFFSLRNQYNVLGTYRIINDPLLLLFYTFAVLVLLLLISKNTWLSYLHRQLSVLQKAAAKKGKESIQRVMTIPQLPEKRQRLPTHFRDSSKKNQTQPLLLHNGFLVHDVSELVHLLPYLDEALVRHHLGQQDIQRWLEEMPGMQHLADAVRNASSKEQLIKVLQSSMAKPL